MLNTKKPSRSPGLGQHEIDVMDEALRVLDDKLVANQLPIMSPILVHDDGKPGAAFWESVRKHNLRQEDESDEDLVLRLQTLTMSTTYPDWVEIWMREMSEGAADA